MSAGVEDSSSGDAERPTATLPQAGDGAHPAGRHPPQQHHLHQVLIEPEEDRWPWRRKIREDKRKLAVYRIAVGLLGLILVVLGAIIAPLPGPGGAPLILLGLAVWSSEFEWAHQLMQWLKAKLPGYRTWSGAKKGLFWVALFSCCGLLGYAYLVITGIPAWSPESVNVLLQRLPGL